MKDGRAIRVAEKETRLSARRIQYGQRVVSERLLVVAFGVKLVARRFALVALTHTFGLA